MKKTTLITVFALIACFAIGNEHENRERPPSSEPTSENSKTAAESRMHRRGGGENIPKEAMMIHALQNHQVAEKIGLNEEQREAISRKVQKIEDKNIELKYKMEKAALRQARLLTAKELDEDALTEAIEELGEYRTEMAKQRIELLIFMRKNLSPEQIGNMRNMMRERMNSRRNEKGENWRRNAKNSSEKPEGNRRERPAIRFNKKSERKNKPEKKDLDK